MCVADGHVYAFGSNDLGQLGVGSKYPQGPSTGARGTIDTHTFVSHFTYFIRCLAYQHKNLFCSFALRLSLPNFLYVCVSVCEFLFQELAFQRVAVIAAGKRHCAAITHHLRGLYMWGANSR